MDDKIDLADLAELAVHAGEHEPKSWAFVRACDLLALVAAVRAARASAARPTSVNNWKALDAALAPFTDSSGSAEVRSDD